MLVGDHAKLELASLQLWDDDAVHLGHVAVRVGRDAEVRTFQASLGGDVVRMVETADYAGPGRAARDVRPLLRRRRRSTSSTGCSSTTTSRGRTSNVDYRGALQGKRRPLGLGRRRADPQAAEGIQTYESNRNLVLTEGCQADSVPNLEIETGEIQGAGHASATGRFDDEQLFYLQSRGITPVEARRLVVHGFFADLIRRLGVDSIERRLLDAVEAELAKNIGLPTVGCRRR